MRKNSTLSVKRSSITHTIRWSSISVKEDNKTNSSSKKIPSKWQKNSTILWSQSCKKYWNSCSISQPQIPIPQSWVTITAKETSLLRPFYSHKKNKDMSPSSASSLLSSKPYFKISKISTSHKEKPFSPFLKNISFTWFNSLKIPAISKSNSFNSNSETISLFL